MKVVIDTNVIISAALGSQTCKEAILKALEKYEVIEPKIVSMEKKWKKKWGQASQVHKIMIYWKKKKMGDKHG